MVNRTFTKEDVLKAARDNDVKFVRLQFTDMFGTLKNVAITAEQLEYALDNRQMFDGSSIEGFARIEESDMVLHPDPSTFTIFPWRPSIGRVARLICDVYLPDGSPFTGDPRYVLRRAIKQAADMGYTLHVGPECEFFLFNLNEQGEPTIHTHDYGGYFDLGPIDRGEDARRHICLALEEMGYHIEASHHEVAPGQHEIDFRYSEALKSADDIMTFKLVVKSIAHEHGLHATFMPKPIYGVAGSGMHINLSLSKDGNNVFADENDEIGLSEIAYNFMAGLLEHIRGITALANPLVNSYKRLVTGYEAPVHIAWATRNRSPLIRIPAARGAATRLELRSPDPSCNPYLALAAILTAGLDGIKRKLKPPASVEKNIYHMTDAEREAQGIGSLPHDLQEAIRAMQADPLVMETLGKPLTDNYIAAKLIEWNQYQTTVHEWETDRYLSRY